MTELAISVDDAEDACARLTRVGDAVALDLRAFGSDPGAPGPRDAVEQWLGWVAMRSGVLAGRVQGSGRAAADAAGLLTDTDQHLGRATAGMQVAV